MTRLRERDLQTVTRIQAPPLYLDPEGVLHLFGQITGKAFTLKLWDELEHMKDNDSNARVREEASGSGDPLCFRFADPAGFVSALPLVFEALTPVLEEKIPLITEAGHFSDQAHEYVRIRGTFQTTRFPDGELNLEVAFAGIRGMLFFTRSFFSSMIRPLLEQDRFFNYAAEVEALVVPQSRLRKTIFYHQTYGDNSEHDWLPIVPVVMTMRS